VPRRPGTDGTGEGPGAAALRRLLAGASVTALTLTASALVGGVVWSSSTATTVAGVQEHTWRNVEIGGGGFVPGIVFSRARKGLVYSRTDIGGAYRWDQDTGRWVPLLDWVPRDEWGWNGVVGLAADPVDADKVYAAVGMYTNSWDPNNGAVLRSSDRGATWKAAELPFKLGGNMPGRGMGERLAVDPNKNSVLYLGAPSGRGLWRSTDSGASWSQVTSFPNPGDYVADPGNEYGGDVQGVVWVTFDESSGKAGSASKDIYVGVADKENTVYRSTDAGATWSPIAGHPTGYIAHKGVVDPENHVLYLATSDTGGPYDGAKGDVWKYGTVSGDWKRISPVPSTSEDDYFGYSGLTVDRSDPGTLMVATQVSWWPDAIFFRSTDAGSTWTRIWDWDGYPARSTRYVHDISSVPWLDWGQQPSPPEVAPKLGWMNESVEIDPFDSDRMLYGTGATIYGTTNLTDWDAGKKITIRPVVGGLEETAALDLISPPSGAHLISGLGDVGGFRHDDLGEVPAKMFTGPSFTSTTGLDYAGRSPNVIVRAGNFTDADRPSDSHVAFSTDGGSTWFQGTEPSGIDNGGTVAAGADGSRFVWAPQGRVPVRSVGFGNTWERVEGLPTDAVVESDRADPLTFYGFSDGRFYVSTDGGAAFVRSAATGLPDSATFKAVPGEKGHLWMAGGADGLFRSTDSGKSFSAVPTVTSTVGLGFGKAAPGSSYPALYLVGTVDGVDGAFRSDDTGTSWVRINDAAHQYGNWGDAVTGDPRVYGRVYIGTNGRGVLYADPDGPVDTDPGAGPSSPTSSPTATPTRSPSPTDTPTSTPTATPTGSSAGAGCSATYETAGSWQGGFQGTVTVRNAGSEPATGWSVRMALPPGVSVSQVWNGTASGGSGTVTVTNATYNGALAPAERTSFGFLASGDASPAPALTCSLR